MGSDNFVDKAWLPPMRLNYSQKNKLFSFMRLMLKIISFNGMRFHQTLL